MSDSIRIRLEARFSAELREFAKRHIVFWRDAEGAFADEVAELSLPNVTIITLTGRNNFAVKKLLTVDDLTGNYLIYKPFEEEKSSDNWLRDIELYSDEAFWADQTSERLSALSIDPSDPDMRKAFKVYDKFFKSGERMTKLQRLGAIYRTSTDLHTGIMVVLCGLNGGGPQEVIKAVLAAGIENTSNSVIDNITRFGNISELWYLVNKFTGYVYDESRPLSDLAAHILLTSLSQNINKSALVGLEKYVSQLHRAFCYQLIHEWQYANDRDVLVDICRSIESKFNLNEKLGKVAIEELLKCDTFPLINELILEHYFGAICERIIKPEQLIKVVEARRTAGWYELTAYYFECLFYAAKINEYKLSRYDGFHTVEAQKIWRQYMETDYEMDSYYRNFHLAFGRAIGEASAARLEDALKKVADVIENVYHNWFLKEINESWTRAIEEDLRERGCVSSIPRQDGLFGFYNKYVRNVVAHGNRAVVIISDALRFEVAAELAEKLSRVTRGKATVDGIQAIFPSITKFGMAALLPHGKISVNEKQEVLIDGKPTASTAMRDAVLRAAYPKSVAVQFTDLQRMKRDERRELVQDKDIVYIYHDSIDTMGENNETKVFEACDTMMPEIATIVNIILNDLSSTNIFITADHGFLYTYNPLTESDKISKQAFSGNIYEIGRRYALVAPETMAEFLLPVNLEKIFDGAKIKGYAPRDTIRIKTQGGGVNYVHGGISLQEMCVPVIVYKGARSGYKSSVEARDTRLIIVSESRRISNKIFTLDFLQRDAVSDKIKECKYSVFFIDMQGNKVSDTQTIIANRTDASDASRVYKVKFALKHIKFDKDSTYRLVITNDTGNYEEIDFKIELFTDDFGF